MARFHRPLGCFRDAGRTLSPRNGNTSCTLCLRQTGDLMQLTPWCSLLPLTHTAKTWICADHRLFFLGLPMAVLLSPDLVPLTKDPPSARHPHSLASISTLTRDPSSLPFEIVTSGFNKGYPNLVLDGKHISTFVRGCLDDCDLFGWLCRACGVARILLRVVSARSTEQAGLMHYSARSSDTCRRVMDPATVLTSGACTRSE